LGPQAGLDFVEMVLAHPCDEVIGIGLDSLENDPRPFQRMFERARNAGLHVTAHAGEIGPAPFVRDALSVLGSERIDHGYHVVDDAELVMRCRALGTFFTVCPTTTTYKTPWYDLTAAEHPIRRMIAAGLRLTIGTDAPALMRTTLVDEYRIVAKYMRGTPMQLKEISLNGMRASWLDERTKERRVAEWSAEIDALLSGSAA
jgi:adenosine deaminase